jgi:hypothetical protein
VSSDTPGHRRARRLRLVDHHRVFSRRPFKAVRSYLPYTAETILAGTLLGSASFAPSRDAASGAPLPFAAATALLAGIAPAGELLAARSTLRHDIT